MTTEIDRFIVTVSEDTSSEEERASGVSSSDSALSRRRNCAASILAKRDYKFDHFFFFFAVRWYLSLSRFQEKGWERKKSNWGTRTGPIEMNPKKKLDSTTV